MNVTATHQINVSEIRLRQAKDPNADMKNGIWAFVFLLIFEGALRKWGPPALSTPLLIVRDPIVVWLLFKAIQRSIIPVNGFIIYMVITTIISFFATLILGHGNLWVDIFGARIPLLYFPCMFVIGQVLTRKDLIVLGKYLLIISIPMTLLIALQFYSPQSAWVNRGLAGNESGSGFSGANGYFRPSGTFSFTSGNTLYYGLLTSCLCYFWLKRKYVNTLLLTASTVALIIAVPLSISRTLISEVALSLAFLIMVALQKKENLITIIIALIIAVVAIKLLSNVSFFATATDALTTRFEQASDSEQGNAAQAFWGRLFGGFLIALDKSEELPFFGVGLGMGTNAGSALMTGSVAYLVSEGEMGRVLGEQGFLIGLGVIIVKIVFAFSLLAKSAKYMFRNDPLPWLLLSFGFLQLITAQMGQPTSLGFSTLIGGLILASFNK